MSAWTAARLVLTLGLSLLTVSAALFLVGAWTTDGSIAATALVALVFGIATSLGGGFWCDDTKNDRPLKMPRKERRRVAAEKARIAADAEIARLEREAGL